MIHINQLSSLHTKIQHTIGYILSAFIILHHGFDGENISLKWSKELLSSSIQREAKSESNTIISFSNLQLWSEPFDLSLEPKLFFEEGFEELLQSHLEFEHLFSLWIICGESLTGIVSDLEVCFVWLLTSGIVIFRKNTEIHRWRLMAKIHVWACFCNRIALTASYTLHLHWSVLQIHFS